MVPLSGGSVWEGGACSQLRRGTQLCCPYTLFPGSIAKVFKLTLLVISLPLIDTLVHIYFSVFLRNCKFMSSYYCVAVLYLLSNYFTGLKLHLKPNNLHLVYKIF